MDGEKVRRFWRPLSSGSKNDRIASLYKQRNPRETRTSKLFGLLFELNRRMPNGTYGGVRGRKTKVGRKLSFSSYSI